MANKKDGQHAELDTSIEGIDWSRVWWLMLCSCRKFAVTGNFISTEPNPTRDRQPDRESGPLVSETMAHTFARKRHKQSALSSWYQVKLRKSPFLFFGLPFLSIIVLGSYALSNFTTIRYERHDQKVKVATEEDLLRLDKDRRRPDIREEYNVSCPQYFDLIIAIVREGFG